MKRRRDETAETIAYYEGGLWHGKVEEMSGTPQQGFPDSWPRAVTVMREPEFTVAASLATCRYVLTTERRVVDHVQVGTLHRRADGSKWWVPLPELEPVWARVYRLQDVAPE